MVAAIILCLTVGLTRCWCRQIIEKCGGHGRVSNRTRITGDRENELEMGRGQGDSEGSGDFERQSGTKRQIF